MKVGVFTPLLSGLPLDTVLKKLKSLGIDMVAKWAGSMNFLRRCFWKSRQSHTKSGLGQIRSCLCRKWATGFAATRQSRLYRRKRRISFPPRSITFEKLYGCNRSALAGTLAFFVARLVISMMVLCR